MRPHSIKNTEKRGDGPYRACRRERKKNERGNKEEASALKKESVRANVQRMHFFRTGKKFPAERDLLREKQKPTHSGKAMGAERS